MTVINMNERGENEGELIATTARLAEVALYPLTQETAAEMHRLAQRVSELTGAV